MTLPEWTKTVYPEPLRTLAQWSFALPAYTPELRRLKGGMGYDIYFVQQTWVLLKAIHHFFLILNRASFEGMAKSFSEEAEWIPGS